MAVCRLPVAIKIAVPYGGHVMRRLLAIVGLLGIFLTPIPEVAFGGPPPDGPGGLAPRDWGAPAGSKDGQRGALLTRRVDGGPSLLTPGNEGQGHQSPDEAARGRQNQRPW